MNNIFLDDQDNDYDCGAFILLHLKILFGGYIHGSPDLVEYL